MNNKGFMMAEVVVVSAVILVTLTGLYISYGKILSAYNQRVNYYDVTTLYRLSNIRDINYETLTTLSSKWKKITTGVESKETVYYLNKDELKNWTSSSSYTNNINQTFKDYIQYLKDSIESETDNFLVMERCIDTDNCKYAYLEVFK